MKITIDTQTDTYDDIKKVLHILTNIIEQKSGSSAVSSSSGVDTSSMMSMFSDDSTANPTAAKEVADTPPDFSAFLNLTKNQTKKAGEPLTRVEFF